MAYNWCLCGHTKGLHEEYCTKCYEYYVDSEGYVRPCLDFKLDNLRYLEAKAKIKDKKERLLTDSN